MKRKEEESKKKVKMTEKIIQISGDFKQLWALTNKGNVYWKKWRQIDWSRWIKMESIEFNEILQKMGKNE